MIEKRRYLSVICSAIFIVCVATGIQGQHQTPRLLSLVPADTLHEPRLWLAGGTVALAYTGSIIALNEAWYKQFPRTSFHLFDDWGEWEHMDKMGHVFTTYFESYWTYRMARWTGMQDRAAMWTGVGLGMLFQTTVEVLDGFSAEWGFSLADMGFNVLGAGAFLAQQLTWGEQRLLVKMSSTPVRHPGALIADVSGTSMTTLRDRADALFGRSWPERFLKDYNAQTIWVSANLHAFFRDAGIPPWLNVAIGYSAHNMYGGFANHWTEGDAVYHLSRDLYPRYWQLYLSPDIDFSGIRSGSPLVRTLLGMANIFKMPGPVLEINGLGQVRVGVRW